MWLGLKGITDSALLTSLNPWLSGRWSSCQEAQGAMEMAERVFTLKHEDPGSDPLHSHDIWTLASIFIKPALGGGGAEISRLPSLLAP